MEVSVQCPTCGAEMFEGAHFCMACGGRLTPTTAQRASSLGLDQAESDVDGSWEGNASPSVVPDDELEIEEVTDERSQVIGALRQVRDYLIEFDLEQQPSDECLRVCRDVMGSLNGATEALGRDVANACRELKRALEKSRAQPFDSIKQRYENVAHLFPELGDFSAERSHRGRLVVRSILEQVPGLGALDREKLEVAGFSDLEALCRTTTGDLQRAGLQSELAERVYERIARFKRRLASVPPEADRSAERRRLRRLTDTLKEQNREFEALADDWQPGSREARHKLRDARAETMSQVTLLLARLGELGTQERMERLPFDKKADELERLLGALETSHEHSP